MDQRKPSTIMCSGTSRSWHRLGFWVFGSQVSSQVSAMGPDLMGWMTVVICAPKLQDNLFFLRMLTSTHTLQHSWNLYTHPSSPATLVQQVSKSPPWTSSHHDDSVGHFTNHMSDSVTSHYRWHFAGSAPQSKEQWRQTHPGWT